MCAFGLFAFAVSDFMFVMCMWFFWCFVDVFLLVNWRVVPF